MSASHDATEHDELAQGLRLAALALASAVMTATIVIGVGGAWLDRSGHAAKPSVEAPVPLIRTLG
ncbi:hypothetical protein BH09PSE1_BH09PSE1_23820 [soil metagenome]